jgi:hypothetical protein
MRAIVVHEGGGPDVLKLEDVPEPTPNGKVLVRVEAAAVNHFDITQRMAPEMSGANPLFTPGVDAAETRADTGERVLVSGALGSYAELVAAPPENVRPIPDSLDVERAAALGVTYKTAWAALSDAELQAGETLVVQAGSSGTGQAAIDIGRYLGAKVYATAGSSKHDRLRELGGKSLHSAARRAAVRLDRERRAGLAEGESINFATRRRRRRFCRASRRGRAHLPVTRRVPASLIQGWTASVSTSAPRDQNRARARGARLARKRLARGQRGPVTPNFDVNGGDPSQCLQPAPNRSAWPTTAHPRNAPHASCLRTHVCEHGDSTCSRNRRSAASLASTIWLSPAVVASRPKERPG